MIGNIQNNSSTSGIAGPGQFPQDQSLTDDQREQIQSILSNYDSANLTADDAKSIFKQIRESGIRSHEVRETIAAAGIDPEKLRALAGNVGPSGPGGFDGPGGPIGPGGPGGPGRPNLGLSALKSLQSILSQYDLSALTSDQETDLFTKLTDSGLLKNGNLLDLSA